MKKWKDLPVEMQIEEVKPYYDSLSQKKFSLFIKRVFDIMVSSLLLIILSPLFLVLPIIIKLDSHGPVFFRQVRITQYGKRFRIFKFRTMVNNAEITGSQITVSNDNRITRVGKFIRKYRLDEIAQLLDVLRGTMTLVGVRPEVDKFVKLYTAEMKATLLMPAGVTSLASIYFKDEEILLYDAQKADDIYINRILPEKMRWNLLGIRNFSIYQDVKIMLMTFTIIFKRRNGQTINGSKI